MTHKEEIKVAALAGRRPDAADSDVIRFPLSSRRRVKDKIRNLFIDHNFTHLICAAACGADLLALEVASDLMIEYHIILPFLPEEFRKKSVVDRPGNWGKIYDRLIDKTKKKNNLYLLGYSTNDKEAFSKTTQAIIDHTSKIAGSSTPFGIVVWDGRSRGTDDATQEFADLSQKAGFYKLEILTI